MSYKFSFKYVVIFIKTCNNLRVVSVLTCSSLVTFFQNFQSPNLGRNLGTLTAEQKVSELSAKTLYT